MLGRLEPLVPGTANSELQKPGQEAPTLASFFATKSLGLRSAGPRDSDLVKKNEICGHGKASDVAIRVFSKGKACSFT